MNAAIQALRDGKAALDAQHPYLFFVLLAALAGLIVFVWRKVHLASFERLPKSLQFLPAALFTGLIGGVTAGDDPKGIFWNVVIDAFAGLAAVGGHHTFKSWLPAILAVLQSMRGGGGGGTASGGGASGGATSGRVGPSAFQRRALALALAALMLVGCSAAAWQKGARTALDIAQIACALSTKLSSEEDVARACNIESDLRPHLRDLLQGKASAQRELASGPACPAAVPPPAGASDAGSDR